MVKKDLIDRSPIRFLEQAADGGLKNGEMGLLASKKGLGKTSVLVQLGIDMLLQDKQVVHVSFNQHTNYVMTWYGDIFTEMSKKKNLADADDVKSELMRQRVILNFNQDTVTLEQIVKTLSALAEGGVKTACLIIDGLDFSRVTAKDVTVLKDYAKQAGFVIWASCNSDNEDISSAINADVEPLIEALLYLEQKTDSIHMKVVKLHSETAKDTNLKLDTKTLLVAEK